MKLKEAFKKLEAYNEIATIMHEDKKRLYFCDETIAVHYGETFSSYEALRKYIRHEYIKDVADAILNADDWTFGEKTITTVRGNTVKFSLYPTCC